MEQRSLTAFIQDSLPGGRRPTGHAREVAAELRANGVETPEDLQAVRRGERPLMPPKPLPKEGAAERETTLGEIWRDMHPSVRGVFLAMAGMIVFLAILALTAYRMR